MNARELDMAKFKLYQLKKKIETQEEILNTLKEERKELENKINTYGGVK